MSANELKSESYSGKFRLLCKDDWPKLPAMRWQIKDLVPLHGVTLLFGQPKVGKKSFIGISLACAVAAGEDWCGHETQKGDVLYVVGEGFYGILRRQAAWEKAHGCSVGKALRYLRAPVNFSNADDVKAALKALKAQGFNPSFIVIDTLARSMSGAKENVAEDMSRVFELLEAFRAALSDASILVIHHTTKDGLNYRGSSVIPAAVDGLIESKANGGLDITLTSAGFKDVPEFDPFDVRCEPVLVETEDGWQDVLAVVEQVVTAEAPVLADADERNARKLVQTIAQHFPNGATFTELHSRSDMRKTTFSYALKCAEAKGWIVGGGGKGQPYNLKPQNGADTIGSGIGSLVHSLREGEPTEPIWTGSNEPKLNQSEPMNQAEVAKSSTQPRPTKSSTKSTNVKSPPTSPLAPEQGVDYAALDEFAEALEQLAHRPSRTNAQ